MQLNVWNDLAKAKRRWTEKKNIDKMIEMGAAADPKLLKDAAEAHHKAIGSISEPNGVTSRETGIL